MERFEGTVLKDVEYVEDRRVHVRRILDSANEDREMLDIREYIVSLDEYGRGITVPIRMAPAILEGVEAVVLAAQNK